MIETSETTVVPLFSDRMRVDPDGRPVLLGIRCSECARKIFPPSGLCPSCGNDSIEPAELARTGRVWTYTVVNVSYGSIALDPPYVAAFVELTDGAYVHTLIIGCEPGEVRIGMEVELDTIETKDGEGQTVVYAFRPVAGSRFQEEER
jgi:uncharacterized OB-fold protein